MYTGSVLMIFKQYTLNGKRRVSDGKRHVIQRKQTRENVCGLCLNANSCMQMACFLFVVERIYLKTLQYSKQFLQKQNLKNLFDVLHSRSRIL